MKVELHCHTSLYSACASGSPREIFQAYIAHGYDVVYLTEHHRMWRPHELAEAQATFPQLRILPGVELNLVMEPLTHLLVLGATDAEYLMIDNPAKVLEKARTEGHLTVLAHPCRWEGGAYILDQGLRPDAIEYRTCNQEFTQAVAARDLAERLKLPFVSAGDTHVVDMVGRYWIETSEPIEQADDIRRIVLAGKYQCHSKEEKRMFRPGFKSDPGRLGI
jgi:predicted metal-dependent phosphoesterase TrpH